MVIATFYFPRFGLIVMLLFVLVSTDMPIGRGAEMGKRSISIRVEDIILIIVTGGWFLRQAKLRRLTMLKDVPLYRPILVMSAIIVIATLIGQFQGTVTPLRGFFFAMKRLEYFWIFFMTLNIMESDKEAKIAVYVLLLVSVVIAFIGMIQFFLFPVHELTSGGATGAAGFGRANTMGDFLLIMIGLALGLAIFFSDMKASIFFTSLLVFFVLSLLMSKSRGAYVSTFPVFGVIFLISKSRKVLFFAGTGVFFVLLYVFILALGSSDAGFLMNKHQEEITQQFSQIGDVATKGVSADSSMQARVDIWEIAMDEVLEYPFFGQGCGSKRLGYADNQYVREALETGLIGLVAFLYMNASIFLFMLKYHFATRQLFTKALTLGFMGGHAGILVHAITMSNFYTIFNMEVFWFVASIISLLYYNEHARWLNEQEPTRN